MKYDTIVTHRNFHHDEAWAIFLLKKYGEEKYPGISQAKVRLVGNPQGVNALELIARGEICVGVARSMRWRYPVPTSPTHNVFPFELSAIPLGIDMRVMMGVIVFMSAAT